MKLLTDDEPHLLPDTPQTRVPWYARLLKKTLSLLFSPPGITVSMGGLLVLGLTGLISLNYLDTSRSVDKNGISLRDFYADTHLEVVDQEATQRKIDRTKQTIPPVYQDATPHNQDIEASLEKLLNGLDGVATETALSLPERYARFTQKAGGNPNADSIFDRYFKQPMPESDWLQARQATQIALDTILMNGFTEADEQLKRGFIIQQSLIGAKLSPTYKPLSAFLLNATLEPNLILDEPAMKRKQMALEAQILRQPEVQVYKKGQKIVGKGEVVKPVAFSALEKMGKSANNHYWVSVLGIFLLCLLFVFTLWSYLHQFKERQFFKPAYASLIATLVLLSVVCFHLQNVGAFGDIPLYALPLGAIALMLAIFTHPFISVVTTTLLVLLLALTIDNNEFSNLSVLLFGSYMGIYVLHKRIAYSERGQLMYAGFYVGVTSMLILMIANLLKPSLNGVGMGITQPDAFNWGVAQLKWLVWSFASGMFSGILAIGSLPLLETLFGLITPYTLMELGNHDQPLLKRMQFEAPGTFHHSLMVATLSEAAAEAIGANALLTRVGCLYHDIGKMKRPLFFIENQAYFGVENPHDKLTPRLSKMVITAHPRDSLEMAKQHKLPEVLMSFMTEHHGTLTAGYFYNKACQEEGAENVNKSQFRYPGPKPGSRETAIVMLADACESSVRALKNPTVAQVEERIDKIIQQRLDDGQFDHCPITFQDLNLIKQTFVRILRGIQHNRIEYQQNMMRELGRKLPSAQAEKLQAHAGLRDVLEQTAQTPIPDKGQSASPPAHEA